MSPLRSRLLRNNRGVFLTLDGERKVRAGLEAPGASDGIGWTEVEVTADMVGMKLAVFTAVETKTRTGSVDKDQRNFIQQVLAAGGLAGVARSPDDAVGIVTGRPGGGPTLFSAAKRATAKET